MPTLDVVRQGPAGEQQPAAVTHGRELPVVDEIVDPLLAAAAQVLGGLIDRQVRGVLGGLDLGEQFDDAACDRLDQRVGNLQRQRLGCAVTIRQHLRRFQRRGLPEASR
jgi:hypothetical protein